MSQLFSGTVTGYNSSGYNSSGNNLIIKDIVLDDDRNNTEYQCRIEDSGIEGDPIFLHVAGEYICICHEISVYTLTSYVHTYML